MITTGIFGKLISYDAETKELVIDDQDEKEIVTVTIQPDTDRSWVDWSKYIGEELHIILVNGKAQEIVSPGRPDILLEKDGRYESIKDQPSFKMEMENLIWYMGKTIDLFDYEKIGFNDYLSRGIYVAWYYGVKEVRTTGDILSKESYSQLPRKERIKIKAFLEYCAEHHSIIYWRDHYRFTWAIIDEDKYRKYCKYYGYKYRDFLWYSYVTKGIHNISY